MLCSAKCQATVWYVMKALSFVLQHESISCMNCRQFLLHKWESVLVICSHGVTFSVHLTHPIKSVTTASSLTSGYKNLIIWNIFTLASQAFAIFSRLSTVKTSNNKNAIISAGVFKDVECV